MPRGSSSSSSRSSGSRSQSRSFYGGSGYSSRRRSPSAPDQVVVRYPGGIQTVFTHSNYQRTPLIPKLNDGNPKLYDPTCQTYLRVAIETTLLEGTDTCRGQNFRDALRRYCDMKVDVGESKSGSSSTSSVQEGPYSGYSSGRSRSSSPPNEVVVRHPDGIQMVFTRSNYRRTLPSILNNEDIKLDPDCKVYLKVAVETTLLEGTDTLRGQYYRDALVRFCDMKMNVGESKSGSTSTS